MYPGLLELQGHVSGKAATIDSALSLWETKTSRSSRGWIQLGPLNVSRNGGIGRRAWFRSTFSQGSGGSSPLIRTIQILVAPAQLFNLCGFRAQPFRMLRGAIEMRGGFE